MKRYISLLSLIGAGLGIAGACLADGFVTISDSFVTSTLAYIGQAVTGLGPILYVVIGIPLAFWVVKKVISLVPKR